MGRPDVLCLSLLLVSGLVLQDDNVKVTAAIVEHPLVPTTFAYRFDGADRSIVISGDTHRADNLVKLAQGVDVLVHEAMWVPGVDRLSHLVPADDERLTDQMWIDLAAAHFKGRIVVAKDLMEI